MIRLSNFICVDDGEDYFEGEDNRLLDSDIIELAIYLNDNPDIHTVILNSNKIGDESAILLASIPTIKSLDLGNNYIGDKGALALASTTNLKELDVSNNNDIGIDGVTALIAIQKYQTSVNPSADIKFNK